MIKRVKRRFILLSMLCLVSMLTAVLLGMNGANYAGLVRDADHMLTLLSSNKGGFPDIGQTPPAQRPAISPEAPYESRYFTVMLSAQGEPVQVNLTHIAAVDRATAVDYAQSVYKEGKQHGFLHRFRYLSRAERDTYVVTFLDCGRTLDAFKSFLLTSTLMSALGLLLLFFVLLFFSGRLLRPVAESYEKQRRFIGDAGHEIKTPLTIIAANTELLELDMGENECLSDIRQQTAVLTALTQDLIGLARLEEGEVDQAVDFPLSDVVSETAAGFRAPAEMRGITLELRFTPMLSMRGQSGSIARLVALLMDNAVKYAPENSTVQAELVALPRQARFAVRNPLTSPLSREQLSHLFDRFYRADSSRSSSTGGHGIGLAMAQAIVRAHGGRIRCSCEDGYFTVTVHLPLQ